MKKIIFYISAILFCLPIQAQQRFFGVIQDADGYTNVRDTSGTVIGKLLDNHVFVDWDAQKSHKEWHSVEYGAETGITKTCRMEIPIQERSIKAASVIWQICHS